MPHSFLCSIQFSLATLISCVICIPFAFTIKNVFALLPFTVVAFGRFHSHHEAVVIALDSCLRDPGSRLAFTGEAYSDLRPVTLF